MPEIFQKDCKLKVIEYGEDCSSFPLWDSIKERVMKYFNK